MTQPSRTALLRSSAPASTADNRLQFISTRYTSINPVPSRSVDKSARRLGRSRRQGQPLEAFEQLLLTSRAQFVAMAYSILRNKEDAEDAVQNAFLSAYLHLRTFEGRAALKTWFTRIVLNAALMIRRKRKPSRFVPLGHLEQGEDIALWEQIPASEANPEKAYADEEALQRIDAQLAKMRPALRQAFTMTYYRELPHQEASRMLDIPTATFKARLFRARRLVVSGISASKKKLTSSAVPRNGFQLGAKTPLELADEK